MSEPSIAIHEDDEGMRNLYPLAARAQAEADMQASIEASERNRAADGIGWTDVHVIKPPSMTFADVGLTLAAATAALEPLMPRIRRFSIGLSGQGNPFASRETDAYCFGFDSNCFVKLEPKGAHVERIWFEAPAGDAGALAALRRALLAIDALAPAFVADYWLDATGAVGDPAFLDGYFAALA